jgi:hypothetical protein
MTSTFKIFEAEEKVVAMEISNFHNLQKFAAVIE